MSRPQSPASEDHLFAEFEAIVEDAARLIKSSTANNGELLDAAKASVQEGLEAASARLAKVREQSERYVRCAAQATDRCAHENPWRTAGVLAAVCAVAGLAAGMLIARR